MNRLRLTDYIDHSIIAFFVFSMYFIVHLYVLTTHVTVCICHTEIKATCLQLFVYIEDNVSIEVQVVYVAQ